MRALFLSPHPDDVELFCGGTVARLAARTEVWLADLTRGEMSSNGTVESRAREAGDAARVLGLRTERRQLELPDAGLDGRDADQLAAVLDLVRESRCDLLFAPWVKDRHPDHVAAAELARRVFGRFAVPGYSGDAGWVGPKHLLHYPCHSAVEPTLLLLLDVSAEIETWEAGVRCYRSQFAPGAGVATPINRPGFVEHHRRRRARWGRLCEVEFAEGFVHEGPWPLSIERLLEG
jgi:bacillithiol biosynthesis deacetylase BshB1